MTLDHIHAFTDAMRRKKLDEMLAHMSDDIVLKTPLAAEPLRGKQALTPVVAALLGIVDTFEFLEFMQGPEHVSSFFKVTVGETKLDAMDYWRLDDSGRIREMTVLWRPLPAIAAVAQKLG
jgi:hypothetical protein